jgi:hypothetical protein
MINKEPAYVAIYTACWTAPFPQAFTHLTHLTHLALIEAVSQLIENER